MYKILDYLYKYSPGLGAVPKKSRRFVLETRQGQWHYLDLGADLRT